MSTLLKILGIVLIAPFIYSGYKELYQFMWASLFCSCLLMFFGYIDKIKRIKIGNSGFEAETKELNSLIGKAKVTISELQKLGKLVGEVTLSMAQRSGRTGGYTEAEKKEIKKSIIFLLTDLGLEKWQIDDLLRDWHTWVELDYVFCILGNNQIPEGFNQEQTYEWKELRRTNRYKLPRPEELQAFLEKNDKLTQDCKELIEDYKYYRENRSHRRYELWENHLETGRL